MASAPSPPSDAVSRLRDSLECPAQHVDDLLVGESFEFIDEVCGEVAVERARFHTFPCMAPDTAVSDEGMVPGATDIGHGARRTRLRSSAKPARPNIWRLSILIRLTCPSTTPEFQGRSGWR
ncbi:hypothetical protein AQJ30_06660 [Streptomyces longwoodensis]|uniref:Uncharacterized protein n=1 Tax=Streptomyces longwoodensis TaxID=68231 RepID=A0A101R2J8_9ACTN|nr:hypothetical protein AQJ30_06660 [Streptomyces longwoodensis]